MKRENVMDNEILIVREDEGYRVLHGHLRMTALLFEVNEILVKVYGEGKAKVIRTADGFIVHDGEIQLPLLRA
jgi:hypothetical protein